MRCRLRQDVDWNVRVRTQLINDLRPHRRVSHHPAVSEWVSCVVSDVVCVFRPSTAGRHRRSTVFDGRRKTLWRRRDCQFPTHVYRPQVAVIVSRRPRWRRCSRREPTAALRLSWHLESVTRHCPQSRSSAFQNSTQDRSCDMTWRDETISHNKTNV